MAVSEKEREYNRAYHKKRYAEDMEFRERKRSLAKEYRGANLERVQEYDRERKDPAKERARNLLRNYGITEAQWQALFEEQGAVCAVCGTDDSGGYRGWHVDHCHGSDTVRGILCANCNHGLGKFKDDPQRLLKAAAYLTKHGRPLW